MQLFRGIFRGDKCLHVATVKKALMDRSLILTVKMIIRQGKSEMKYHRKESEKMKVNVMCE